MPHSKPNLTKCVKCGLRRLCFNKKYGLALGQSFSRPCQHGASTRLWREWGAFPDDPAVVPASGTSVQILSTVALVPHKTFDLDLYPKPRARSLTPQDGHHSCPSHRNPPQANSVIEPQPTVSHKPQEPTQAQQQAYTSSTSINLLFFESPPKSEELQSRQGECGPELGLGHVQPY